METTLPAPRPISALTNPRTLIRFNPNNALLRNCNKQFHESSYRPTAISVTHYSPFNFSSIQKLCVSYTPLKATPKQKRPLSVCTSAASDEGAPQDVNNNKNGSGGEWVTSILLFGLWAALLYYVIVLSPNQTPSRDDYFLQKLLNLKGDDGFRMNQVLVSLWYIMGFWPLVYTMLLVPSGRSSNRKIPVWPFLVLSCIGGAYALLPYFVLWRPPAPPVEKLEGERWPLNFLESKITAVGLIIGGILLFINAGVAGEEAWNEFFQYFRESKLVHATSIDFMFCSSLASFWVYNDMTFRNWLNKGSWLLPLTLVPYLGPALYLALRPSLPSAKVSRAE